MPVWDSETINRFSNQGEDAFTNEYPCIIERIALDITQGTAQYLLPDYITNVRKVQWKGKQLYPITHRSYREYFDDFNLQGSPINYVFNNINQQKIQFVPVPNESVASVVTGLFGPEVINRVIIEYYRTPDHFDIVLPAYFRRKLLKCYVAKMCFAVEGKGQNSKASKYFSSKWDNLKGMYSELLDSLVSKPRRLISVDRFDINYRNTPFARLSRDKFGASVDY